MSKALVLAAFAAILAACATTASSPVLRGHYYWGHEVESFSPCGSKQSFWVVGDAALLKPIRAKAVELSQAKGKPYQPVYVEVSGVSEGKANDGFAADYDGVVRFTAVRTINSSSPSGCPAPG